MNYSRIVYYYPNGGLFGLKKIKVSKLRANFMIGYYHPILILDKENHIIEYQNKNNDEKLRSEFEFYFLLNRYF